MALTRFVIPVLAGCCMAFGALASADVSTLNKVPSPGDVLNQIHHINQKEISLAKMALQKTQDPQLIAFAHRMIKDHTAADSKTEHVARIDGIALQSFTPSDEESVAMNRLNTLTGTDFDAAYMDAMKSGHEQALKYLESTKPEIQDKGVKSLVSKLIPAVEHHERMATNIAANLSETRHAGQPG